MISPLRFGTAMPSSQPPAVKAPVVPAASDQVLFAGKKTTAVSLALALASGIFSVTSLMHSGQSDSEAPDGDLTSQTHQQKQAERQLIDGLKTFKTNIDRDMAAKNNRVLSLNGSKARISLDGHPYTLTMSGQPDGKNGWAQLVSEETGQGIRLNNDDFDGWLSMVGDPHPIDFNMTEQDSIVYYQYKQPLLRVMQMVQDFQIKQLESFRHQIDQDFHAGDLQVVSAQDQVDPLGPRSAQDGKPNYRYGTYRLKMNGQDYILKTSPFNNGVYWSQLEGPKPGQVVRLTVDAWESSGADGWLESPETPQLLTYPDTANGIYYLYKDILGQIADQAQKKAQG